MSDDEKKFEDLESDSGLIAEFWQFIRENKKFWLIPIIVRYAAYRSPAHSWINWRRSIHIHSILIVVYEFSKIKFLVILILFLKQQRTHHHEFYQLHFILCVFASV